MTLEMRTSRATLIAVVLLAPLGAGRPVLAQDDGFDDLETSPAGAVVQPQLRIAPVRAASSSFDLNLFGNLRNVASARVRAEAALRLQVDEVDRVARLTDAQRRRLELAGRGDLRRFFDRVEEKRMEYLLVRDRQKLAEFVQELRPLRAVYEAGLFGPSSIFARAVATVLGPEQAARYEADIADRGLYRLNARALAVVATLDGMVGLTAEQRMRLESLILKETRLPDVAGSYDYLVVTFQLARLPPERLKAGLSEAQWRLLGHQLDRARTYEQVLRRRGLLPVDPPREARAVADPVSPKAGVTTNDATNP